MDYSKKSTFCLIRFWTFWFLKIVDCSWTLICHNGVPPCLLGRGVPTPWGALGTKSIKPGLTHTKHVLGILGKVYNMDDRNTPQFTIGELLNALDGLKREQGMIRSNVMGLVENMHNANARGDAEDVQHYIDWISHDALGFDRLKARQRQVESAIRTLNRLVKAFK